MRVLFATDGSRCADRARDLLATLPWPHETQFCVACAVTSRAELLATPWPVPYSGGLAVLDDEAHRHADVTLDDAERTLTDRGWAVERVTLAGRAASAILEEARAWRADLIVLGSRGHGPFVTMLLGSVSAEVVDHAPCPVLVVRSDQISSIVFADDGSPHAARAATAISGWPVLNYLPVDVISVADIGIPWSAGMPAGLYDQVIESYVEDVTVARAETEAVAERSAEALRTAGVAAAATELDGDPAHAIVEFAHARPGALVVIGTRGRGGIARVVLGSVARNVLLHATNSVLVVRAPG